MRNRGLHDALRDFALEVAATLAAEVEAGAEVPFELVEERTRGPVLYHYRALTSEFIAGRWELLRSLPSCSRAAETLGAGAAPYLRVQGLSGKDAEPALRAMLDRLYEEATSFAFPEERFERVYSEVERTLYEGSALLTILCPLDGLELSDRELGLGDGLALVRPESATGAPRESHVSQFSPPSVTSGRSSRRLICVA